MRRQESITMDTPGGLQTPANGHVDGATSDIDESLYSRQLYVLGHKAMRKMARCRILISGMSGLGAEIAKNVILSGMKQVCLHDQQTAQWDDLSSHFYLSEADIGKNRAAACLDKMRELNSYVETTFSDRDLTPEFISHFDVVVMVDALMDTLRTVNRITHPRGIKMLAANTYGLFAILFNDFGDEFEVVDVTGEHPISTMIADIEEDGVVACQDETRHGFEDGDYVTFSEVEGMPAINGCAPKKIQVMQGT